MPTNPTTLHVLLASPNDVSAERDVAQEVIEDLNVSLRGSNIRVELIRWEQHSRPELGRDAQEVLNRQLGDEYDILIGIMWARFGSPTQRAGSGTEEEFNQALEKAKHGAHVEIMFYFKASGPRRLEDIDVDQLKKVQASKRAFGNMGCNVNSQTLTTFVDNCTCTSVGWLEHGLSHILPHSSHHHHWLSILTRRRVLRQLRMAATTRLRTYLRSMAPPKVETMAFWS